VPGTRRGRAGGLSATLPFLYRSCDWPSPFSGLVLLTRLGSGSSRYNLFGIRQRLPFGLGWFVRAALPLRFACCAPALAAAFHEPGERFACVNAVNRSLRRANVCVWRKERRLLLYPPHHHTPSPMVFAFYQKKTDACFAYLPHRPSLGSFFMCHLRGRATFLYARRGRGMLRTWHYGPWVLYPVFVAV